MVTSLGCVHTPRVNIGKGAPAVYKTMAALDSEVRQHAASAGLEAALMELVKIRVSQINGCAFCLQLHTREAVVIGEDPTRLAVLPAWEETDWFSARERAALRLAEAVTLVADGQVPDEVYGQVAEVFTEAEIAAVAWVTIVINAYNRIAITSRYPVGPTS